MSEAYLIDAVRTPMGGYRGALSRIRPDDMAAHTIAAVVERTGVDPERIVDVYLGAANQSGEDNRDVARMAALYPRVGDLRAGYDKEALLTTTSELFALDAPYVELNRKVAGCIVAARGCVPLAILGDAPAGHGDPAALDHAIGQN